MLKSFTIFSLSPFSFLFPSLSNLIILWAGNNGGGGGGGGHGALPMGVFSLELLTSYFDVFFRIPIVWNPCR